MRLLIVRHADPDYEKDSLTPTGWQEAELLAGRLSELEIAACYTSPLGRARDTASRTLERMGLEAEVLDWLQEFPPKMFDPEIGRERVLWDWLPAVWTREEAYYDRDRWCHTAEMEAAGAPEAYQQVCRGLDALLARHGYQRQERYYRAVRPNRDTVVLFCHFGVESVLLSHVWGVSPMPVWHGFCAQPSSVTTLVTEERREGIASLRMLSFGDISHLYEHDEEPSFAARFCECYGDDTRHD